MTVKPHDCIVGLYHNCDDSQLVTLDELKREIENNKTFNAYIDNEDPKTLDMDFLKRPEYTIKDYFDGRRRTNFKKFKFCPECGKKIEVKA